LNISNATVRWDAADQVSDSLSSQIGVLSGGVADLNGKNETLGHLTVFDAGRVQSTGGRFILAGQLGVQGSGEVELGAGELELRSSVIRSGSSSSTSRIEADVITLNRVQAIFSVADSPAAVELEVTGDIAGAFATTFLEKSGEGALRLTGAATYQAGTTVSGGTLIVDNTAGSGTGTGTVSVQTGALLTGDGAISGPVAMQNGARISPAASTGFPIGSLTIGNLSMNTTSAFEVQFNQALPLASRRDVLTVSNFASLNGNLILENLNASLLPDTATTYTILAAASLSGSFTNVANGTRLDTLDGSGSFVVNYGLGSPFDPSDVVLSSFLPASSPGDYNRDGAVNGADYTVWRDTRDSTTNLAADGDGSGTVDTADYNFWRARFGQSAASSSTAAVPEPAAFSFALACIGAGLAAVRRNFSR
jgi:autotransporter-associated beta strand protein